MSAAERFIAQQEVKALRAGVERKLRRQKRASIECERATKADLAKLATAARMPLSRYVDKLLAAHVRGMKVVLCITRK